MNPRILIPPGIGDAYWVLVKLRAFLSRENLSIPYVSVVCSPNKYGSEVRSIPYLRMFPFLRIGSPESIANEPTLYNTFLEAYSQPGRTIFPGFMGYDYFISYNGHLNSGGWLEKVDPDLICDWYPEMIVSDEQKQFQEKCVAKYGRYVALYFPFFGSYEHHMKEFSIERITLALKQFFAGSHITPVFIGTTPDVEENNFLREMMAKIPDSVDLVGKLTLDQTFGLVKGSSLVVGYHSGLTNMAAVFKKRTLLLWSSTYPPSITLACFPPDTRRKNYQPVFAKGLGIDELVAKMLFMLE